MSVVHVAIVDAHAAARLLTGRKRVESRFTRSRRLPYGRVSAGDQIHFKANGGGIIGHACATRVCQFDDLTPDAIQALRVRYNRAILAPPAYWDARRHCRYGVLIWLSKVIRQATPLAIPRQHGNGWVLLTDTTGQPIRQARGRPRRRSGPATNKTTPFPGTALDSDSCPPA